MAEMRNSGGGGGGPLQQLWEMPEYPSSQITSSLRRQAGHFPTEHLGDNHQPIATTTAFDSEKNQAYYRHDVFHFTFIFLSFLIHTFRYWPPDQIYLKLLYKTYTLVYYTLSHSVSILKEISDAQTCLEEPHNLVTLQHRFPSCSCFCVPRFILFLLAWQGDKIFISFPDLEIRKTVFCKVTKSRIQ